jgi:DNA-binding IclR family transcriptional regulator
MERKESKAGGVGGSQTLMRGLDVVEAVAAGSATLQQLSDTLELTRSTAHRLAASLVERGYLAFTPRSGYRLGPKLLQLGHLAQEQANIIQVARPYIEDLAQATDDTVHLGVLEGDLVLYLDKMPGKRRITISSRVGDRQPLTSTGLGKALMLDHPPIYWEERFLAEHTDRAPHVDIEAWHKRMAGYVDAGRAFDLEENEDQIRCVAAPVRDASGRIVAAISVSSAAQYMSDERLDELSQTVTAIARAISRELGCTIAG